MKIIFTLLVIACMVAGLLYRKIPAGIVTMGSCILLAFVGIIPLKTAFSGFSNQNFIIVVAFFVLSAQMSRTSFFGALQRFLAKIQHRHGTTFFLFTVCAVAFLLANMLPRTASMVLLTSFLIATGGNGAVPVNQFLMPLSCVVTFATYRLPLNSAAQFSAIINDFLKANQAGCGITVFDLLKVGIFPTLAAMGYILLCYRFLPERPVRPAVAAPDAAVMPRSKERLTYFVFAASVVGVALGSYTVPVAGVLLLYFCRAITYEQIRTEISTDMVFMLAGLFAMGDVVDSTGVSAFAGNLLLRGVGAGMSGFGVLLLFGFATMIISNCILNMGASLMLLPITVSTACAAGFDPRGLAITVLFCCGCSFVLPTGTPSLVVALKCGSYRLGEQWRFTIPLCVLSTFAICVSAYFFFPL